MRAWSPTQWLGFLLVADFVWIYVVFLLRRTKAFIPALGLGVAVAVGGLVIGGYCLFTLVTLSQTAGEAGLGGIGAIMGIALSIPFCFMLFLYRRAYRRYRENA